MYTGEFHASIFLDFTSEAVYFNASAGHYQYLRKRYATDSERLNILGLTDDNIEGLATEVVTPYIIERFRQIVT